MEYDIIEKVVELGFSGLGLSEKIKAVSKLMTTRLPFDQCAIYLWDGGSQGFTLAGLSGDASGSVEYYGKDAGVPGLARSRKKLVEVSSHDAGTCWEGIEDAGLKGYKSAFAYPLTAASGEVAGILYLKAKSIEKGSYEPRFGGIVASQIAWIVKYAGNLEAYGALLDNYMDVQSRLINSEKLMALGDMAATLAHDIRNPLMSIGGYALRLKKKLGAQSPYTRYVDQMLSEVSRIEKLMNGIVRTLNETLDLKLDDMNEIIEDALGLFEDDLKALKIKVKKDFYPGELPVVADREQIKIAFDNLIANAIQSMEKAGGAGTLVLKTGFCGDCVTVEVADSGGGIDPRHLKHIFNPFFTTKEHGTGLGLPITNSIIMRHKGIIEIENRAGAGVTFTIKLPHASEKKGAPLEA